MRSLLGVNLPYFYGAYGHDLAPNPRFAGWPVECDVFRSYRPLLEARWFGFEAARVWLCEGGEGVVLDGDGHVSGVHPQLLDALDALEECAALSGLRLYFTLLDANAAARDGDALTRRILSDRDEAARFAERVVAPIAARVDPRVTLALELLNEPETVTEDCRDARSDTAFESVSWEDLGQFLSLGRLAARAERPSIAVTAGTMHVFLPKLWRSGAGLDAVDVHVYHPRGGLPSREDLARYVGDEALLNPSIALIAGECGVPKGHGDEEPTALCNYLVNAEAYGYAAAFLWKLEGDLLDAKSQGRPATDLGRAVTRTFKERPEQGYTLEHTAR